MNKSLKEKILFIAGGAIFVFGLIFVQKKFPTTLDGSHFLAQVPGENTYEECVFDPTKIIQNGDFSQLINFATPPDFVLSDQGEIFPKEVCFFEGLLLASVRYDSILSSNVLKLMYVRHVFDGNPNFILFNSSEPVGAVQYIDSLNAGSYDIHFKARLEQQDNKPINMYIGFSDTIIQQPYPYLSNGCYLQSVGLGNSSKPLTRQGTFQECVLDQFDSYTQVFIDSSSYEEYQANITIPNSGSGYIYFLPKGEDEDWLVDPWVNIKPYAYIYIDDLSIVNNNATCGISFSGEGQLFYNNQAGEYVEYTGGNISIEGIGNNSPENINLESFYLYSPVPGYLHVQAPTNVEYTDQDIMELFSIEGGNILSATSFSGSNFWIEYECLIACSELPQDFNQDGIVNEIDLNTFMSFFGQSCDELESCQFDFNNDEIIETGDLMIFLASVGRECGIPLGLVSPEDNEGDVSYTSNGMFVKPTKIPGIQNMYNYVIDTKFLEPNQTSLRIEQFFPHSMILRGLYSSTKNISLISKEGIVKFFDLGKTKHVTSYLYIEAPTEMCRVISQNKKAYEAVVSYGLCK